MPEQSYGAFIASIIYTLQKNGYPSQRVSLGLDEMYRRAYERGLNFNKVLCFLEEKGIFHEKKSGKIIFHDQAVHQESQVRDSVNGPGSVQTGQQPSNSEAGPASGASAAAANAFENLWSQFSRQDLTRFKNMDFASLMSNATEVLKNMSPEQLQQMQSMVANLSEEQRQEMMERAKAMGLF